MLEIITQKLSDMGIVNSFNYSNAVLKAMEKAGMEPPPHQEMRGSGYSDEYGNEELWDEWVQGWEAE